MDDEINIERRVFMNNAAKEARARALREWRRRNPDKARAASERYWERRAQRELSGEVNSGGSTGSNQQTDADSR